MKKFIKFNDLVNHIRNKRFTTWIDKLTFYQILFVWVIITVLIGLAYYFFTSDSSYLFRISDGKIVDKAADAIYFSFVGSTTTGYGDIIPKGLFKIIYPAEVILALMLVAIVTSKLISIKQNVILNEIYETSFNERIYKIRSSLLLFRQNINRMIHKVEENSLKKREIYDFYTYLSFFEDTLNEVNSQIDKAGNRFTKIIDPLNTELIFNSITQSFEKINEMISILSQSKLEWKKDTAAQMIGICININKSLLQKLSSSKAISEEDKKEINSRNGEAIASLKKSLEG